MLNDKTRSVVLAAAIAIAAVPALSARYTFVLPAPGASTPRVLMFNDLLQQTGSIVVPPDTYRVLVDVNGSKAIILSKSTTAPVSFVNIQGGSLSGALRSISLDGNAAGAAELSPSGEEVLVLSEGQGGILYRINIATESIVSQGRIATGTNARDFSVSYDGRWAFVVSATAFVIVELPQSRIERTEPLESVGLSVSTSPRGSVYVGLQASLAEYDAFPPFARKGVISAQQFGPGKLVYTPDGRYGLAPNLLQTGVSLLLFNLESRGITNPSGTLAGGVPFVFNNQLQVPTQIEVMSDSRALVFLDNAKRIQDVTIPDLRVSDFLVSGSPLGPTDGLAASEEYPNRRNIYYSVTGTLGKFDTAQNLASNPAFSQAGPLNYGIVVTPGRFPVGVTALNGGQVVPPASVLRPYFLRLTDGAGRPVSGSRVSVQNSTAGTTVSPTSAFTNKDGVVAFAVTAPLTTGDFSVIFQTSDLANAPVATVTSTVAGGSGGGPGGPGLSGLIKLSGDGQILPPGPPSDPVYVRVIDAEGRPVAGRTVTFSGESGAIVRSLDSSQSGTVPVVTDADGQAGVVFSGGAVQPIPIGPQAPVEVRVVATSDVGSVSFVGVIHAVADGPYDARPTINALTPPVGARITMQLGQKLDNVIQASIRTRFGLPIANVGMRVFTPFTNPADGPITACEGGTPLSTTDGVVSCNLIASGRTGETTLTVEIGANAGTGISQTSGGRYNLFLTVLPGDPAQLVKTQGDAQRGRPGAALPTALQVAVQDSFGNPLIGIPLQWTVVTPGSLTLRNVSTVSGPTGRGSAEVTLGPNSGTFEVRVTAGSRSATFTATIDAQVGSFTKISGDNQTAITGQPFGQPLVVQVLDTANRPIPNMRINWALVSGLVGLSAPTSDTGPDGRALINVTAGTTAGTAVVSASMAGQPPLTFTLNIRLPGPVITPASFTNYASGEAGVTAGGLVVIKGQGLAPGITGTVSADLLKGSLPLSLNETTVEFIWTGGSQFAPIYSVTNASGVESIVAQVPFEIVGPTASARVIVKGGNTTVQSIPVLQYSLGIIEDVAGSRRSAVLIKSNGTRVTPQNPALRGETIRMYVVGLGQTTPTALTNAVGVPGQIIRIPITVGINYQGGVTVTSAHLAENLIGVYEVVFIVPANAPAGADIPLNMSADINLAAGERFFSNDSLISIGQ